MRPHSEIRIDLAAALVDGGGTTKQLAQRTGWAIGMTRRALGNMVTAGDVCKPRSVKVPGVKRPVPVYERAVRVAERGMDGSACCSLIAAWAGVLVVEGDDHAGA